MRKFLRKIAMFGAIGLVTVIVITMFIQTSIQGQSYALDDSRNILAVGHSTGEFALDPQIIGNLTNCCQSGESFFRSYTKLQYLLRDNPNVDTVFMMLSPTTLTPWADYDFFYRGFAKVQTTTLYPLLKAPEFFCLARHGMLGNDINWSQLLSSIRKKGGYVDYLGRFNPVNGTRLQADVNYYTTSSKNKEEYEREKVRYGNTLQVEYLQKTVGLCRTHGVELILIQPPVYNPRSFFDVESLRADWAKFAQGVEILDFMEMSLADSCYFDVMHLNSSGAAVFSSILKQQLIKHE